MPANTPRSVNISITTTPKASAYTSSMGSTLWRNTTWLTGFAPYTNVPHLRGNPLTGRLPYMQGSDGLMHNIKEAGKLAQESPAGMCSFWVENQLILLITEPSKVYQYKLLYQKHMQSGVPYWDIMPGHSMIADPKQGPQLRKIYQEQFRTLSLNEMQRKISAVSDEHIQNFKHGNVDAITDAGTYFRKFALELTASLFMNIDYKKLDADGILDFVASLMGGAYPSSVYNLLGLRKEAPQSNILIESLKSIHKALVGDKSTPLSEYFGWDQLEQIYLFKNNMQRKLQELILNNNKTDILANDNVFKKIWKLAREVNGSDDFTLEDLFPDAFFFIAGGIVTTTGDSFPIIIQLICNHPAVKEKLMKELNSQEDNLDIDSLPYLDMIIKEAFRLNPPVPIIPTRSAKEAFKFHGIEIRKGDSIVISPLVSHHLTDVWEDSQMFNPERFNPANESDIQKGAYIPFGLGERNCVGSRYGMNVLKTLIAKMFLAFDLTLEITDDKFELAGVGVKTNAMKLRLNPHPQVGSSMRIR
jgi:cytochrome P450